MKNHWRAGPLDVRFWRKVRKTKGCWIWVGARSSKGYGSIQKDGKRAQAHRVAYELQHGPVPTGMVVMHTCDNRACVRGDHLIAGTQSENILDSVRKGRHSSLHHRKLSAVDVDTIRMRRRAGVRLRVLAKQYNVSISTIHKIVN